MAGDLSRTLFDLVLNYYFKTSDSFFSFLKLAFVIYRNFRATAAPTVPTASVHASPTLTQPP